MMSKHWASRITSWFQPAGLTPALDFLLPGSQDGSPDCLDKLTLVALRKSRDMSSEGGDFSKAKFKLLSSFYKWHYEVADRRNWREKICLPNKKPEHLIQFDSKMEDFAVV